MPNRRRRRVRPGFSALAGLSVAGLALAAPAFTPPALAQVRVEGAWVALRDVAPVEGAAGGVLVAPSPPPGETLALDPVFLTAVARKAGVVIALPLDEPVWVTRSPASTSAPAAPAPRPALTPEAPATAPRLYGEALVLVRDVARGERIGAGDVEWRSGAAASPRARGEPLAPDAVIGREARRTLRSGDALAAADLREPMLVRRGEPVRLTYTSTGLRLSVEGVAQGDGAAGGIVRVFNPQSKRILDAVVTGEAEASVGGVRR